MHRRQYLPHAQPLSMKQRARLVRILKAEKLNDEVYGRTARPSRSFFRRLSARASSVVRKLRAA